MWNTRREDQVPAGILPYLQWDHAWFHAYVYWQKRLRPFYRQRLKTTRQVVRCVRLKRTVWYLFWQQQLKFYFSPKPDTLPGRKGAIYSSPDHNLSLPFENSPYFLQRAECFESGLPCQENSFFQYVFLYAEIHPWIFLISFWPLPTFNVFRPLLVGIHQIIFEPVISLCGGKTHAFLCQKEPIESDRGMLKLYSSV